MTPRSCLRPLIPRACKSEPLADTSFFHGKTAGRLVVDPINLPVGQLFVEGVVTESRKRGASRVDLLAVEFEMGLFPAALSEAKNKGIDLAPRYIPADVFDTRAVDKGQVVFHDTSFIEATPHYAKENKLALAIELNDFSVCYTQGTAEAAITAMKEGKSDVLCEGGQLVEVSKSKDGVVKREKLTKHWTDWVDYRAVDFDYRNRKETIKVPRGMGVDPHHNPPPLAGEGERDHAAPLCVPIPNLPPLAGEGEGGGEFEDRWTGGHLFENEWQSSRTRRSRELELKTAEHVYQRPGRYTVAVKVIDLFGNDTMTLVPVNVG